MFGPLQVTTFIRDMLRDLFLEYGDADFVWSPDVRLSKITIGTINDINSEERKQQFPRILVQRGPTFLQTQFIGGNFARTNGGTVGISTGDVETYRQDITGSLTILIETRQEGTCESLAEYVRKFICWSRKYIESQFGFNRFGNQMQISQCDMDLEDTERFKISINIPYIIEEKWETSGNLTRLNHVFHKLKDTTS